MENIVKIIDYVFQYKIFRSSKFWSGHIGLIIFLIGTFLLLGTLFKSLVSHKIITLNINEDWHVYVVVSLLVFFIVTCIWAFYSKRIYIRDNLFIATLFLVSSIGIAYIVTNAIQDLLLQLWNIVLNPSIKIGLGCLFTLLVLFIVLYVETKHFRKKKLLICIAINQVDYPSIEPIKNSLNSALDRISARYDDIEFICLPYDLLPSIKQYDKYINRLWVQADALIFASVINDGSGQYAFTNFSSRLNTRRVANKTENEVLNKLLGTFEKEKDWNNLNAEEKELTNRIQISENLYEMFLMYVTCVYLIKRNYSTAVNISREVYQSYANQYGAIAALTNRLFSFALLMNALSAEAEHNYALAKERIDEYAMCFPAMEKALIYQMAMARLHYYLGNIYESKHYTQLFKATDVWGYSLNMGFYAIIEGKVGEFSSNYKRLLTKQRPTLDGVQFAIRFLVYEKSRNHTEKTMLLLRIAIPLLYLYIDYKKSRKMLPQFRKEQYGLSTTEIKSLAWVEASVIEARDNFLCLK